MSITVPKFRASFSRDLLIFAGILFLKPTKKRFASKTHRIFRQDPKGNSKEWECAFRTTRRSECDGVAVVVFVRYPVSRKEDEVLLISQYRPPVGAEVREERVSIEAVGVR